MKTTLPLVLCLAGLAMSVGAADTVQRCEGKDGRVTYSNTQCPEGTTPVRKVNTDPPISVDDQKAAKERARRDTEQVKEIDKQRKDEETKAEREASDRKKAEAKNVQKCDKAKRDLDAARSARAELASQASTIEKIQKSDADIKRRESDVARDCPH